MQNTRLKIYCFIMILMFIVLIMGIYRIQIKQGCRYYAFSEDNRIKHIPLSAPRGVIYDRNLDPLVVNRPDFQVFIIPEELIKNPKAVEVISGILKIKISYIWEKINKNKSIGFIPVRIKKGLSKKQVAQLEERAVNLPGVYISVESSREYVKGDFASHLIGYVGEVNRKELEELKYYGYKPGDFVGKGGVELSYDKYLRGIKGGKQVEVSASGRYRTVLGCKDSVKGNDIVLTIDKRMQEIVEHAFMYEKGTVVIMDPNNGDILAMVSKPSFDPNIFVDYKRQDELIEVLKDSKGKPLINRAIKGQYSPGSIFKLIVGIAGLQEKEISKDIFLKCQGWMKIGRIFRCWRKEGHAFLNIAEAIMQSCNVFFYRLGQKLGVDKISKYSFAFGLGKKTGIELIGEKKGLVPTRKWKKKVYKSRWYPGETANFSIGQGFLLVTPIQLVNAVNTLTNGGVLCQPRIVKKIINSDGKEFEPLPHYKKKLKFKKQHYNVIREGMKLVVNDFRGTGKKAKLKNVKVCGKTGTVQVVGREKMGEDREFIPWHLRNHAWFACFAPYEKPVLSMVVFVEHGGSGGRKAAVVAHDILERIFIPKNAIGDSKDKVR